MASITAPTFRLQGIEWSLDRPAQANIDVDGKRTVDIPLYGKWFANVTLMTIASTADFLPVRSFLFRCYGTVNTFQLPATIEPQNSNSGVTAGAAAAIGDTTLTLSGASTALTDGQMVTVGGQLVQLTADQASSVITFEPPLRAAVASGDTVETANPYATVRMASPDIGWAVSAPTRYDVSFAVEEAF